MRGKKEPFSPSNFVSMTPWLLDSLTLSSLLSELVPALSPPIPYLNARNIKFYKSCSIHYKFLYLEPLIPQFRYPLNQKSTDSGTPPAIFYIPSIPVGIIPESGNQGLPYCTWYNIYLSCFAALFLACIIGHMSCNFRFASLFYTFLIFVWHNYNSLIFNHLPTPCKKLVERYAAQCYQKIMQGHNAPPIK